MDEPQRVETSGLAIDQCVDAELLSEPPEFSQRRWPFGKIDEMGLHAALGEKAKGLPRVRIFLDSEYLNFHGRENDRVPMVRGRRLDRLCLAGNLPR